MPSSPGVYIYKSIKDEIIYIGKAKNLKNRIKSYFQPIQKLGPKTANLVSQIKNVEYISVQSEIESLLLEAKLIKKFKPKYNIISKDGKSEYYINLSKDTYPIPIINHLSNDSIAGPFLNSLVPKKILRQLRKIVPFCTTKIANRPCMHSHLGLCNPCPHDLTPNKALYLQNISRLKRLLSGKFSDVTQELKKQMSIASKNKDFEKAGVYRDKLRNLDYLLQTPIPADEYIVNPNLLEDKGREAIQELISNFKLQISNLHRIEMFDIANLSGTAATGAMTVAINGQLTPNEYRHFTIRKIDTPNDVEMMREMLTRRLARQDWPKPDLIILDGGMGQLSIFNSGGITVVALAKHEEIIFTQKGDRIKLERNNPGLQLLQRLRDEAHRFSRRLHHKHRSATIKK